MTDNQENESGKITKKKGILPVILFVVGVIVFLFLALFAAAFAFIFLHGASDGKVKKQLSLGEKYVNELDYDNAILTYEKALEIDPKCEEAYLALGNIYIELAQQSEEKGEYEEAEEYLEKGKVILKQGYKETNSEEIESLIADIDDLIEKVKEIEQEDDSDDNAESGSNDNDSQKTEGSDSNNKDESDKVSTDNKDNDTKEQANNPEKKDKSSDELKEDTRTQSNNNTQTGNEPEQVSETEPEPEPEHVLGSYEGVESATGYGGTSGSRDVSYRVDGNHVDITVNMSELINALNTAGTSEYYTDTFGDIEAAEVEFTDGSNYFIVSYSIDPTYEDLQSSDEFQSIGRPNISNSTRHATLAVSKTDYDYKEISRINASIEGDNLHWSFDIPDNYSLKDKIRITGFYYDDFSYLF